MTFDLCKYKNALGEPNKGIHSYRVAGIAIVDLGLTVLAAFAVARIFNYNLLIVLASLLLLGIFLHRIFCVRTTVDKLLFPCVRSTLKN